MKNVHHGITHTHVCNIYIIHTRYDLEQYDSFTQNTEAARTVPELYSFPKPNTERAKTGKERNASAGSERYQGEFFKYNDTSRKTVTLVTQG